VPQNEAMSLKLFRHTDYAQSILSPGETRFAMHPGWAVVATSLWIGLACNVWLWHAIAGAPDQLLPALAVGLTVTGVAGFLLSLLGWRRTFKAVATLLLLAAAAVATGVFTQGLALETVLAGKRFLSLMPSWTSLFGWQAPTLLALLGGAPVIWLWSQQLRRLDGSSQMAINVTGMLLSVLVLAGGLVLQFGLPSF
jgi:glucan phosphoethanolaminetransferase (alkaline phosphatase superfamily)